MKLEPRLPDLSIHPAPPAQRGRLDDLLARLAQTGYRVDRQKWEHFERAHLVAMPLPTERGERETIRRLRRILDVERRLSPSGNLDALCFHLAAAGIESVPPLAVTRHILASISDLFVMGDQIADALPQQKKTAVGPDGELRLGRTMAKYALQAYRLRDRSEHPLTEALLGAAFVGYVRSTHANIRPGQMLHVSSRLVTLDSVPDKVPPAKDGAPLPPLCDRAGLIAWFSTAAANGNGTIVRAAQSIAALIRMHVRSFPELQAPWRDLAAECGADAATALQALALVPPILTVAYMQAGYAPAGPNLERMLEQLMHFWGTARYEAVRFNLSTGAFPWVKRNGNGAAG